MDKLTRLLHDIRTPSQPNRFVKAMDVPPAPHAVELREMPRADNDRDGLTGFWKRPADDPKPKPRLTLPNERFRNGTLRGVGRIRAASFFRDVGQFSGKPLRIKRDGDLAYRDFRIKHDHTFGVRVLKAVEPQQEQGTLSLVR